MPWFLSVTESGVDANGDKTYACAPGDEIYENEETCECDDTGTSVVVSCTKNGLTYSEGDKIAQSGPLCSYQRQDYINYNEALAQIAGKAGTDPYYCCTEDNVDDLFHSWEAWSTCEFSESTTDPNSCGCTSDPSKTCGLQTRRRRPKCSDAKVDDSTCPCVETQKCEMPLCPVQGQGSKKTFLKIFFRKF